MCIALINYQYARFCFRQLKKISAEGGKGLTPSPGQIVELVKAPFKRPVFGVTLHVRFKMWSTLLLDIHA